MRRDQWTIVALLVVVLVGLLLYAVVRSRYPPIVPQHVLTPAPLIVLPVPSYTPPVTPTPEPSPSPTSTRVPPTSTATSTPTVEPTVRPATPTAAIHRG